MKFGYTSEVAKERVLVMDVVAVEGLSFGRYTLNLDRMSLQEDGKDCELRPKAFDVLRVLALNAGRVISKDELVVAVWPKVIVNDDALAQCIRDIRKALKDDGETFIRTVPRRGYMFVADIAPASGQPVPSPSHGKRRHHYLFLLAALVVLVLGVFLGSGTWRSPQGDGRLTIAVLPFAAEDEWLGDGIAEDVMTAVSRFRDLGVVARNSSFRFRDPTLDPREVGRSLRADYLLQGTVRRQNDFLRITAQLVEARTGNSEWTGRYDRPMPELFTIYDEVADSVAAQLVIHAKEAAGSRLRTKPPQSMEAYELVLRGRRLYRTFSREGIFEAQALAERAIGFEPELGPAWELMAATLLQFFYQPYDERHGTLEALRRARAAAERAVSLDGNFATAHARLAAVLVPARENDAALAAIDRALALNPNDAVAVATRGNVLSFLGRYPEAVQAWEDAEQMDPFVTPLSFALKSMPLVMLGDYERALASARTCAERAPRLQTCYFYLSIAANELHREEEAREAMRILLELNPSTTISGHLGIRSFKDPGEGDRLAELMRRAGLPE
jgi:adenylate cyclase